MYAGPPRVDNRLRTDCNVSAADTSWLSVAVPKSALWCRGTTHSSNGERLEAAGQTGRTVTTKVRYADFSIRSRSTSLPVGTDDAARIWELACACLDRALADRPGALRLVGVGVSGLEAHRQLELV